jgi:hypothetical protein
MERFPIAMVETVQAMISFQRTANGIEADAGFRITDLDETHIRYIAPSLRLTLQVKRISNREIQVQLKDLQQWDPPDTAEALTEHDKRRLKVFLTAAYNSVDIIALFDV